MTKRLYYKSLIFKEMNTKDISLNYLNWFKKRKGKIHYKKTKFLIRSQRIYSKK